MTSILRIENLDYRATLSDVRRIFKDHGARPAEIHLGLHGNGKRNGSAFLIFMDRKEAENGLNVDGIVCRDSRISVRSSNPKEFDKMFPGKPMLSKPNKFNKDERLTTGVVKVENIDFTATPGDIRRFFKEHNARPEDIHLVLQTNAGKHNGCAFLVFSIPHETENALKLNGVLFRDNCLTVKASNPKEFDRYFPGTPMITKPNIRGRGRGRGINRGLSNSGGNLFKQITNVDGRNQEGFGISSRGRGRGIQGGRGGATSHRVGGRFVEDQFFSSRNVNHARDRSRSPINRGRRDDSRDTSSRNFSREQHLPHRSDNRTDSLDRRRSESMRGSNRQTGFPNNSRYEESVSAINERKFLCIFGFPFNASQVDIQNFFRPILTRDIYTMRNTGGKFAGKFNGSAIVEFFSEADARQAIKMNGKKFGHQPMSVIRPGKEDIKRSIEENKASNESGGPSSQPLPDFSVLNAVANSNPQVQHLLNLLTATVNTIAGAAAAATHSKPDNKQEYRNGRGDQMLRNRDDPVISRVASSANIDVSDIRQGRVVGVRNLPYTVTPDEILQFFHNYKVMSDSVRIHYLEDGRCSGDAIICFRGNRDARNAVSELNKGIIGRRKVELFFL